MENLDEKSDERLSECSEEWVDDVHQFLKYWIKALVLKKFQEAKYHRIVRANEEGYKRGS